MRQIKENEWLTDNQWKVYVYVCAYIDMHKFSPTVLEVAKHMKFRYRSQAQIVLTRLCELKMLEKDRTKSTRNLIKASAK